jgi:hypothetical protein
MERVVVFAPMPFRQGTVLPARPVGHALASPDRLSEGVVVLADAIHAFGRRFKPVSISWRIASDTETSFVLA